MLRGFAALWVVLSHYLPFWESHYGEAVVLVPNSWGVYAVKLFFVISGFVIFMTLEKCGSVWDFAVLRFSRLYPTYWASLLVATTIGVLVFDAPIWVGGIVVNATMLQEVLGYPSLDIVYWSLTVELAFYLMVGCIFIVRINRYPLAFASCWMIASCIWALTTHPHDAQVRDWLSLLFALDYSPYFSMGIVYYKTIKSGWSWPARAALALVFATEFLIAGFVGVCVAGASALLLALAINGRLTFLQSKYTLWVGSISYALYLIHRNLGYQFLTWLHGRGLGPELAVPIAIISVLMLATVLTYLIEKPSIRRIRSWHELRKARRLHSKP